MTLLVYVHPSCDMTMAVGFRHAVQRTGWTFSTTDVYYPDVGDTVADSGTFFVGVHKQASMDHSAIAVPFPPATKPKPLASFVYAPFDKK